MFRSIIVILACLPMVLQAQFPMLIGVSPQECNTYYMEQGMEVYFDNEFPDEPASLIAENRDYTITTMFKDEVAIHASVVSRADLSFSMMYEQYDDWVQEGKHKHPSVEDHSIILSAFETTSQFPKLFVGLYDTQHQEETDQALEVLQCDWGFADTYYKTFKSYEPTLLDIAEEEETIEDILIGPVPILPYFIACESDDVAEREECSNLKIISHIYSNIKYAKGKQGSSLTHTVLVMFIVDKTGQVKDIEILEGGNPDLNKEVVRVISSIPKLIPGMRNGQEVETPYSIPIRLLWQ